MKILSPKSANWLGELEEIFLTNEPVALPTETVYGLAASIDRPKAIARIFELKNRPTFNPLIIHVKKEWDLSKWAIVDSAAKKLIDLFWPGPLSLLLPKTTLVPDICTASSSFVVLRAPADPIFQQVLDHVHVPLAAPSANSSGFISPTSLEHIREDLGARGLVAAVDGGSCKCGIESTILRITDAGLEILREGALTREELSSRSNMNIVAAREVNIPTPGSQLRHYSPRVPLYLFSNPMEWAAFQPQQNNPIYLQVLKADAGDLSLPENKAQLLLSKDDLREAAAKLFDTLHSAEKNYDSIVALKTKNEALGRAINDRLERART